MKKLLSTVMLLALAWNLCACCFCLPKTGTPAPELISPEETDAPDEIPAESLIFPSVDTSTLVETAIDYSREIVPQGGTTYLTHHTVKCPALTDQSPAAQEINRDMYDICADAVSTLMNYEEGDYIYHVSYQSYIRNGIVAIVLDMSVSTHYGGVFPAYKAYYYDAFTNEKLTYAQYAERLSIEESQLREVLDSSNMVGTADYDILWAAADGEKTGVMAQSMDFMDEFCFFIVDTSIFP